MLRDPRFLTGWLFGLATAFVVAAFVAVTSERLSAGPVPNPVQTSQSGQSAVQAPVSLDSLEKEIQALEALDTRQDTEIATLEESLRSLKATMIQDSERQANTQKMDSIQISTWQSSYKVMVDAFCHHNHTYVGLGGVQQSGGPDVAHGHQSPC